jgi:hypothetical protein
MKINDFILVNEEKLNRAINGSLSRNGSLSGGVGKEAKPEAIMAEYDKLGGLILKGDLKVKTGCFYDFENGKPFDEPLLSFVENIDGKPVEVDESEAKALKSAKKKKEALKKKVKKKKKDE